MEAKSNAESRKAKQQHRSMPAEQLYEPLPYVSRQLLSKQLKQNPLSSTPPFNKSQQSAELHLPIAMKPNLGSSCECTSGLQLKQNVSSSHLFSATPNGCPILLDRLSAPLVGSSSTDSSSSALFLNRDHWSNKSQFLLACVGNSIGLGNLWHFPYLCYKHGGGSFLFPYLCCAIVIGAPLLLIELSLGQYAALGPGILHCQMIPILKGIGMASIVVSTIISVYFNVIIAWSLVYLFESFSKFKWTTCDHVFASLNCTSLYRGSKLLNVTTQHALLSSEEFFNHFVIHRSPSLEQLNTLNWHLVVALATVIVVLIVILINGVQSSGKVMYFTGTFPLLMLALLLVRGITLDGAYEGIRVYVQPNLDKLYDYHIWLDAFSQVSFSFGIIGGSLTTFASYNRFQNPIVWHTLLLSIIHLMTSVLAGLVIFSMLGFLSTFTNKPLTEQFQSSIGITFITVSETFSLLPLPSAWFTIFFSTLFLVGIHSQLANIQVILAYLFDSQTQKGKKPNKPLIAILTGFTMFLLALPMCTDSGVYILEILDHHVSGVPMLVIALLEILLVSYVYGIGHFFNDLRRMCGWIFPPLIKSHLIVFISTVCPLFLGILLYLQTFLLQKPLQSSAQKDYTFPHWSMLAGLAIICLPLVCIPIAAIHYLFFQHVFYSQYRADAHCRKMSVDKKSNYRTSMADQMSIISKFSYGFKCTLSFRTNELRYQRHSSHSKHCLSAYTVPFSQSPCCMVQNDVCYAPVDCSQLLSSNCAKNVYGGLYTRPSQVTTKNATDVEHMGLEPARCECSRFIGEYNQAFVQEF